jgi:isopentenyl-diphosphate Delta-isomerase
MTPGNNGPATAAGSPGLGQQAGRLQEPSQVRMTAAARGASSLLSTVGRSGTPQHGQHGDDLPPDAELVVLLDEQGSPIGTADKATVHTDRTPLHRAFSCYLFGPDGRLLVTRRALTKRTFPGVWTNSVCGHPAPGEEDHPAIRRRADQELRLTAEDIEVALPHFRYRARSGGIVENEICPVHLARTGGSPDPDPAEVDDYAWYDWDQFLTELSTDPDRFSPWSLLQAAQLQTHPSLHRFLRASDATGDDEPAPHREPHHLDP